MSLKTPHALLIVLLFSCSVVPAAWAQTGTITGTVTDSTTGAPLPGVNVVIQGTQQGAATGAQGTYSISGLEPGTYTLQASFIGYADEVVSGIEVRAGEETRVDFFLQPAQVGLEEVVVVGYGTQEQADVTGSVATVSMEELESLPITDVNQALAGQVAGVNIIEGTGMPGGGPEIQVRGVGSIGGGTDPLYVVDGFALPSYGNQTISVLGSIPPEDIASITVLKDAAATAIYGSRGANGVVLVETKGGTTGDLRVFVDTYMGAQQVPDGGMPELLNAQQFAQWRKSYYMGQVRYQENREPTLEDVPEPYRHPEEVRKSTSWADEILRTAPQYSVHVSVSGGSENIRSYISGGYLSQQGVVLGTKYERFSLRTNLSTTLADKLTLGVNLAPTYSLRRANASGGSGRYEGGFGTALVATPMEPVYNEDGTYNRMVQSPGSFLYPNPVQVLKELKNDRWTLRALASAFAEYEFVEGLSLRSSFNVDWYQTEVETFHPSTIGFLNIPPPVIPNGSYHRDGYLNWLSETTLSYEGVLGENHTIDALMGLTFQQQTHGRANFYGDDFPGDLVQTINAASEVSGGTDASEWSLISYLARLHYGYKDKYLLTATIRRDGSSRFGSNNRWGLFPSFAVGWRLSEEAFLQDVSWLSNLKLRASYGLTGNFQIGNYTYLSHVNLWNYVLGGSLANGRVVTSLGNPDLGWESTREFNVGLDAAFFNSRITLGVDVYRQITEDMLFNVKVPQSSGFSSVTVNRGKIRNQGIEVALTTRNIVGASFSWTTDFNIASNTNEVLALGPGNDPIITGFVNGGRPTHITKVGYPLGMFYGWKFDGLYESQEEIENEPSYPGAIPGNIQPIDVNEDGKITKGGDFTILGSPYPDFTFGLTNSFQYRGFDLRVLLTGSYGGARMRAANEWLWNIDGVFNVTEEYFQDRWISPEDPGDGHTPTSVGPAAARVIYRDPSELWVNDNSHIRVKDVTLGYTVPGSLFGDVMKQGRVYVSVQNALLITGYDEGNPTATNYTCVGDSNCRLVPGLDYSTYPLPRTFTVGMQLTF